MKESITPVHWSSRLLGEFRVDESKGINPSNYPEEVFDLFSVPKFPLGEPQHITGAEVGSGKKTVTPGTVLFCKINPRINRVWTVPEVAGRRQIASTEWIQVAPVADVLPSFLRHFLSQNRIRDYAAANVSGVGGSLTRVSPRVLDEIEIPIPPMEEQRAIVAAIETQFARLDDAVASLKRAQVRLKRYRASVLKAACEGRLVPTEAELARQDGREYEPASVLLDRIRAERKVALGTSRRSVKPALDASSLPELPKGWTWTTLPEIGELARGKSKHRPRNDPRLLSGPYPFVQTSEVRLSKGRITHHEKTYSEFGLAQSRLWPAGTLCITIAANIAESGILTFDACFPDSVVGFIIEPKAGYAAFYEVFMRIAKDDLERLAPATAQKNINLDTLFRLAVPLPPFAEQRRIVAEVEWVTSVIDQMEMTVEVNLKRAESLRQSILRQAFSGRLFLEQRP